MSSSPHRVEFPSQAFNSSSFWGIPQVLGQHVQQKRFQQAGLGQHTQKVCTLPFAASPVFYTDFRSTKLSVRRSEDVTITILNLSQSWQTQVESPQNPLITGSADLTIGYQCIPTPGFEPIELWPVSEILHVG